VPAGARVVEFVSERTRENTQYNDDAVIGLVTQHVVQLHGPDVKTSPYGMTTVDSPRAHLKPLVLTVGVQVVGGGGFF